MEISEIQAELEQYIQYYYQQNFNNRPQSLYEPLQYIMLQKGKRIRPLLCILAFNLYRDDISSAFGAANAIELFHNFSLVHDDVMDDAFLRRGKPSVFAKYGLNNSILSGDVMLVYCYQLLAPYLVNKPAILQVFTKTAIEVCEGQQFDMDFEETENVGIDDYLQMIKLKTSVLLGASLKIGGILGNANNKDLENLYNFGINIGLAFQLMDDWLDAFASPEMFGKAVGGDIINNKKTFLHLKSMELANDSQKDKISQITQMPKDNKKVNAMLEIYKELGVEEENKKLMRKYHLAALENLKAINVDEKKKHNLTIIAETLLKRIK